MNSLSLSILIAIAICAVEIYNMFWRPNFCKENKKKNVKG